MKFVFKQSKIFIFFFLQLLTVFTAKSQSDDDFEQQNVYNHLYSYEFQEAKEIIKDKFLTSTNASKKVVGHVLMSRYYHILKNDQAQLESLNTAKQLAEKTGKDIDMAYVELGFTFIYLKAKNYKQYIKSHNFSSAVFQKTDNNNSLLAILYSQKSNAAQSNQDRVRSKQDHKLASHYALKSNVPYYIFNTYNNLGNFYLREYRTDLNKLKSDTAEYYFEKSSQAIATIKEDGVKNLAKCIHYINLGSFYFDRKKEDIDQALYLQNEVLKIIDSNPKLAIYQSAAFLNLGVGYELKKEFGNAKKSYLSALSKLDSTNSNDYNHYELLRNLSHIYLEEKQFDKAYETLYQSYVIFREINSGKNEKNFRLVETLYESQIKDNEIYQLKEKARLLNKQRMLFVVISLITILLIAFLVYFIKLIKKVNRQKTELLRKEKIRLENESTILKLQNEKIQRDALIVSLKLEQKNSLLDTLNEDLHQNRITSVQRMLKGNKFDDESFKQTQSINENIHPKFFQVLSGLSKKKLTHLDLKYASYIYLNMDNQEIANQLNIDINTVRVTKYRLKIKLGLSKNDDLSEFIQQIAIYPAE